MASCVRFTLIFLLLGGLQFPLLASTYEEMFQKGLQEEAAQNWSAAIQNYLAAQKADPTKVFPEERIRSIFVDRLRNGESINSLRLLLPPDTDQKFDRAGVYSLSAAPEKPVPAYYSFLIWGLVILMLGTAGFFLFRQVRRADKQAEEEETSKISSSSRNKKSRAVPTDHRPRKEIVLTDKTREELQSMLSSTSSLTGELARPDDLDSLNEEEIERLKNSGVVQALADTFLSDLKVEQTESGKYSKLTLDASLFFDESDVEFFENEFGDEK